MTEFLSVMTTILNILTLTALIFSVFLIISLVRR
jgi:hypothetical protein